MKKNYYYSQGFKFPRNISIVDFISTLNENKIVYGNRVKVYFKSGSTTSDFKDILPSQITIDSDKILQPKRNLLLEPKVIKFNEHILEIADLDGRVINYVVAEKQETSLIEDEFSTTWVINNDTAGNSADLKLIIDKSKYVSWDFYPVNEYYSYRYVNTGNSGSKSSIQSKGDIPSVVAKHNNPINFEKYTKWRLEYAQVLIGFYEAINKDISNYSIYMDQKPIRCLDKLNSRRIDINLQGFGNLNRHPYMYDADLYQTKADLTVKVKMPDQLEYMHLKKKYQNYEFLSNITTFEVPDKVGLMWTSHIWWEPLQDIASLREAKDENGRMSYTMDLRCSIHFYEVEDEMYHVIDKIRYCFSDLPDNPSFVFQLKDL